jgi:uncharacterized protein YrrD
VDSNLSTCPWLFSQVTPADAHGKAHFEGAVKMLRSLKDLENYEIGATDGRIGHVKDFYFDDHEWVIRYLVVDTGPWLLGRQVLISPISIQHPNWAERLLPVSITKEQVKDSPAIDTDKPVSRQHEMEYQGYYGYPYYWGGGGIWGGGMYPFGMVPTYAGSDSLRVEREQSGSEYELAERARHRDDDPHLRSCKEVVGYHIHATDGGIGHVESLLVDEETWAIRYMVVNTSNWWQGHKVLVAPQWITGVHWLDKSVAVALTREAVKAAPIYDSTGEVDRKHESALYEHYRRPGYWTDTRLHGFELVD